MGIFREMRGLPVTIRLLDPPLHEFLPTEPKQLEQLSKSMGVPVQKLAQRTKDLHEFNPMLGHRGVRLAITYPEIYAMQVRAILEAAVALGKEGTHVHPEIMIPLAITRAELERMRGIVDGVAKEVLAGTPITFSFGTMIELPRAAILAGELAQPAEFFSFGTNDLTQATMEPLAPTTRGSSCRRTWRRASCRAIPSCRSTRRASGPWCSWRRTGAARRARSSSSASAASTAGIPRASGSSRRSASTT